jgi:hypothetical protein
MRVENRRSFEEMMEIAQRESESESGGDVWAEALLVDVLREPCEGLSFFEEAVDLSHAGSHLEGDDERGHGEEEVTADEHVDVVDLEKSKEWIRIE